MFSLFIPITYKNNIFRVFRYILIPVFYFVFCFIRCVVALYLLCFVWFVDA